MCILVFCAKICLSKWQQKSFRANLSRSAGSLTVKYQLVTAWMPHSRFHIVGNISGVNLQRGLKTSPGLLWCRHQYQAGCLTLLAPSSLNPFAGSHQLPRDNLIIYFQSHTGLALPPRSCFTRGCLVVGHYWHSKRQQRPCWSSSSRRHHLQLNEALPLNSTRWDSYFCLYLFTKAFPPDSG